MSVQVLKSVSYHKLLYKLTHVRPLYEADQL